MAERTFTSPDGTVWQAWSVRPGEHADWPAHARSHLPPALAEGWLCFESAAEKRRLHPIPSGWEEQNETGLWSFCATAEPVRPRAAAAPLG
ncbi:MAG TPA: hypothetical protein VFX98_13530 [Longimicrobiaceae bacterium]|nr:hypothetical protein [Longimicrobiaceae bacterium]